jgi:ankyrin repeat protein
MEKIEQIIDNGANINQGSYNNNDTALHFACKEYNLKVVEYLIYSGADVNITNSEFQTPLHIICKIEYSEEFSLDIIRTLINAGSNINKSDSYGSTPLHIACRHGRKEIVNELLKHGVNIEGSINSDLTPLHIACSYNYMDIADILLKNNADKNKVHFNLIEDNLIENIYSLFKKDQYRRRKRNIIKFRFSFNYWKKMNDKKQIESGSFTIC